jgi:hypothetical protein
MKKIKILTLVNSGGSKFHRIISPLEQLDKEKYEIKYLNEDFIIESVVKDIDYLYIHWNQRTKCQYLSLWKEKYGFKIIQDIDDYWVLPLNHYMNKSIEAIKTQLFDQLILADIVLCSTEFIKDKCLEFNDNCHIRKNYIPIGWQQFQPEYIPVINRKINVGFSGSVSHYGDWMSIKNQFKRFKGDKFINDNYQFVLAGYSQNKYFDEVVKILPNPIILNQLPSNEYINLYRNIDVLLAPLEDNLFNQAKSTLKLLESAVKSTLTISNSLYKEKGIKDYFIVDKENSYFDWMKKLTNREFLNEQKAIKQTNLLNISKQHQEQYKLEQWII